jgi:hypothetical protein
MFSITSRRHPVNFYLTIVLGALFFLGMGIFLITLFFNKNDQGVLKPKDYLMLAFGVGVLALAIYTIWRYYENAPGIVIEDNSISFNTETFSIADITKVEYTGKREFPYLFYYQMEAATLHFNDGRQKIIFDDMYQNAWELKCCLKQVVTGKGSYTIPDNNSIDEVELNSVYYTTFRDSQFISLRGISLWSMIGICLVVLLNRNRTPPALIVFVVLFSTFWYAVHAWLMHYFEVSDNFLVVRNHVLPWKRKGYRLAEIKEVVFETRNKMPICLRIISKNYKNELYPAGTLHKKTWLALKGYLKSKNIKVRNECL